MNAKYRDELWNAVFSASVESRALIKIQKQASRCFEILNLTSYINCNVQAAHLKSELKCESERHRKSERNDDARSQNSKLELNWNIYIHHNKTNFLKDTQYRRFSSGFSHVVLSENTFWRSRSRSWNQTHLYPVMSRTKKKLRNCRRPADVPSVDQNRSFKPNHDVFLTPTKCFFFLCLNLTGARAQLPAWT